MTSGGTDGLRGRRVLLVEDEALVALLLEDLLEIWGCTVVGRAARVDTALRYVDELTEIDGAILDVNLGGQMVFPVADALAARGVPFMFVTGYGPESVQRRYPGAPVLHKPCDAQMLQETLNHVLAGSRQRR